jgi:hypothetical protein
MDGIILAALARQPDTLEAFLARFGDPTVPVADATAAKDPSEPLMLYWMQVAEAPIGEGIAVPGTLVVNFDAEGVAQDLTFLGGSAPAEADRLADWLRASSSCTERDVSRPAGVFHELSCTRDGDMVTLDRILAPSDQPRVEGAREPPALWLHETRGSR